MKLKNKKTGEIGELQITEKHCAVSVGNGTASCGIVIYSSLAELNEEWEDYEEPKEYWRIASDGEVEDDEYAGVDFDNDCKAIGNYFETKEEAEKAVEKLKAWKRLKEKGLRFEGWDNTDRSTIHNFSLFIAIEDLESINKDLDLLFGGEE